jgi:hypothetical protein
LGFVVLPEEFFVAPGGLLVSLAYLAPLGIVVEVGVGADALCLLAKLPLVLLYGFVHAGLCSFLFAIFQ